MQVNAVQCRVTVGIFNKRKLIIYLRFELPSCSRLSSNLPKYDPNYISLFFYIILIRFLFSKCCFSKISTKLYISIFLLFTIFCACSYDDDSVAISGYNLIRSDHLSNTKHGGVCLYCKNYLPLRLLNISYLKESLNFELNPLEPGVAFLYPLKISENL